MSGAAEAFKRSHMAHCSAIEIALESSRDWLAFTSGVTVDRERNAARARRALQANDFEVATVLQLLLACYHLDADDNAGAHKAVSEAIEIARHNWTMDELGLMWGVLLPPTLKRFAAGLLEAARLQHVN